MAYVNTRNIDIILSEPSTTLSSDVSAGSESLPILNGTGFLGSPQIILVGQLGNQGSEVVYSTSTSGNSITCVSTILPHAYSSAVTVLIYDEIEISTATTVGGSKTVLATVAIAVDSTTTNYNDITNAAGYYFTRFKNSINSTVSAYSDPIPTTGYTQFSARSVIDNALGMINRSIGLIITDDYAFKQIDNCQMECLRELKRWSFMQKFSFDLGSLSTGQWKIALPSDCDDQNSNRSIYNFYIGKGTNMTWIDKEKWNQILQDVAQTTLVNNVNINDTTITLTSSDDFDDIGTISIGANQYSYTANNQSTGVLTIAASTTTNTAGQDVFQGASPGTPNVWTTFGGFVYFYPILDATLNYANAYSDYYSKLLTTTTDTQTLVIPDPTVAHYYLAWKFLLKQENGMASEETEIMFGKFEARLAKMVQKETANRTFQLKPRLNRFNERSDDASVRLGNFNTNF